MQKIRVKEVAKAKGYTLEEIAKKLGITYVGLNGKLKTAKLETLEEIAKILDCDIRELIASTKETEAVPLYIHKGGVFVEVGSINLDKAKE